MFVVSVAVDKFFKEAFGFGGKRQAASGKRQAASGKRQAAVLSRTAEPSLFGPLLSGMGPFGQHYTAQESKTRAVFRPSAPWFYLDTG